MASHPSGVEEGIGLDDLQRLLPA